MKSTPAKPANEIPWAAATAPESTMTLRGAEAPLQAEGRGQQPGGKHYRCPDQFQYAVHCNPDHAKGQKQQPDDWIHYQREQSHGPTDHEQNAPEQESSHRIPLI
jgi:hypothetical protein